MKTQYAAITMAMLLLVHVVRAEEPQAVSITIDASKSLGPLKPIWRFFGYDECNYTYMKDGQKLLGELGELSRESHDQVYIRCHHLLTSGDGSPGLKWGSTGIYSEDAKGNPIYNFTIFDRIFDIYMERGLKPYVELGFMPKDLSTHPQHYPSVIDPEKRITGDEGVSYPPKDYGKWRELVRQLVLHCVSRYGKEQAESWYWEVWNEPNISYWRGTPEEFYKLYDYAVDGVRSVLPHARVGGPETAGSEAYTRKFLTHCASGEDDATGQKGSPIDFVSFHAKGKPVFVDGHVRMGLGDQLNVMDRNFKAIASFAQFKSLPIVIGESDPEGMAARLPTESKAVGYRNTTMFSSYTAASIGHEYDLADEDGVNLEGALTWSFEFENKPYFPGFRVLSSNGIDHPVMNVFRMLAKMSGNRIAVNSSAAIATDAIIKSGVREKAEVSAVAGLGDQAMSVLIWNYHDDDLPAPPASVDIAIVGLPSAAGDATVDEYRIDQDHSNAYTVWCAMGSPQNPTPEQYDQLQKAGQLAKLSGSSARIADGKLSLHVDLPRQGVSLLTISWH